MATSDWCPKHDQEAEELYQDMDQKGTPEWDKRRDDHLRDRENCPDCNQLTEEEKRHNPYTR